ncbi:leucine-rich repeat receptor-like protein kinase family protein [Striga asiatica]|uniref:Leucine-rich repeat receptor-like protein kinase family protein n=1 Tax=Striga asiatica TaxID=4170 RepID=A0A5A7NX44_STRAF|nr:leucine-rich repeat receptor-like protein kinase family protein [Striga asiatica]
MASRVRVAPCGARCRSNQAMVRSRSLANHIESTKRSVLLPGSCWKPKAKSPEGESHGLEFWSAVIEDPMDMAFEPKAVSFLPLDKGSRFFQQLRLLNIAAPQNSSLIQASLHSPTVLVHIRNLHQLTIARATLSTTLPRTFGPAISISVIRVNQRKPSRTAANGPPIHEIAHTVIPAGPTARVAIDIETNVVIR